MRTQNDIPLGRRGSERVLRPKISKNLVVVISVTALVLLGLSIVMGLWSERAVRETVANQFNAEQLVIARNVAHLIAREFHLLEKEIVLIGEEIGWQGFDPGKHSNLMQKSLARILESGVRKIEIVDFKAGHSHVYIPYRQWIEEKTLPAIDDYFVPLTLNDAGSIRVSRPQIKQGGLRMLMGVSLGSGQQLLVFNINLSWFLNPLIADIRSGQTGYAWVIDEDGIFLSHPKSSFIGEDAFTIRKADDPRLSYRSINHLQREMMAQGKAGKGLYTSAWHRGITGEIKKLIAYYPVIISHDPVQRWFVAVVAPVSEIESAVQQGYRRQLMLQGLVIAVILLSAGTVLFFEIRWSRILEGRVSQRTDQLRQSEGKYRSLVESAEDFIFTVDPAGNFISMNTYTANFFGGRPEEFLGRNFSSLFSGDDPEKHVKLVDLVHKFGKSVRDELELKMDDHRVYLNANFMPIKDETGDVASILCIARDITENKNLERQLINAEKLASLGTLAAGVAHEINNPLGVILGFCDLLVRKKAKDSQEFEDLKTIERQGLHCKEVVENLLSFARIGEEITEYSDLNACIGEIIKVVGHTLTMKQIDLVTHLAAKSPLVKGDSRQLQQVFLNLINNAVAAMPDGGRLVIQTCVGRDNQALVKIQDNGQGIKSEHLDHIFEPFFTTKPEGEGTGLGLFVSYGIISKFGGTIDCVSQDGSRPGRTRGTRFSVKLVRLKQEG